MSPIPNLRDPQQVGTLEAELTVALADVLREFRDSSETPAMAAIAILRVVREMCVAYQRETLSSLRDLEVSLRSGDVLDRKD